MPFKDSMNSNDNYGNTNNIPVGGNEEKLQQARQRTTGSISVIKNKMGAASERQEDRHILGYYNTLTS